MSLLLEALKKAEKAKEEAQRRARGEAAEGREADGDGQRAERKAVLTRDNLPHISAPLDLMSDELAPQAVPPEGPALEPLEPAKAATSRPAVQPAPRPAVASRQPRSAGDDTQAAGRATAKKVFEAKFREPNPRMPFYITMSALGLFALGTVVYFWYQLRPPSSFVYANPVRSTEAPVAAAEAKTQAGVAAPYSAAAPPAIPGLPSAPRASSAPTRAPAASAVDPARPELEVPRLAPRPAQRAPTPAVSSLDGQASASRRLADVHPKVNAGYSAYLAGDAAAARAEYYEALREEPANRDALLGIAALDVRAGRYESAEALYLRVLQLDPRDSQAQAALVALRSGRSDPLVTESRVKSLLAADPGAHALNFTLGNQFAQQNRWAEAQQEYFKAFAAEPDNADFAYNLAVSLDHLRQPSQALEYYQRALSLAEKRGASFDVDAARARATQLAR